MTKDDAGARVTQYMYLDVFLKKKKKKKQPS